MSRQRWLAMAWLVVVVLLVADNLRLGVGGRLLLDTDVLALLPAEQRDPAVAAAIQQLAASAARHVVVLLAAADWTGTRRAADAFEAEALRPGSGLSAAAAPGEDWLASVLETYRPYRLGLLAPEQRAALQQSAPEELARQALQTLYRAFGRPRLVDWRDDPLGTFDAWLQGRLAAGPVRAEDGRLLVEADGRRYALLLFEASAPAFSIAAYETLLPNLERARTTATAAGAREVLAAGIPLHAAAAAAQASREVSTIGLGALAGIVLLAWLAFRSLRPIALVLLSIAVGCLAAVSGCALLFERLHLLTLVFGASLVGVAEDYGIHWFAARQGRAVGGNRALLGRLLPGLTLALATTALAYAALGFTPFPGLRQMGVFSLLGLSAAFLTVICWFPLLDRGPLPQTGFARLVGASRARWPRLGRDWRSLTVVAAAAVLVVAGLSRLEPNDDLRALQGSPPGLMAAERRVGALLQQPSPAQFYLVQGADAEETLRRERALTEALGPLVAEGWISGWRAVSDWLPPAEQQLADSALVGPLDADLRTLLGQALGDPVAAVHPTSPEPLRLDAWLASPVSLALRQQWLGCDAGRCTSVVAIAGLDHPAELPRLAALAASLEGVRFVDKVADYSELLGRYRALMGTAIAVSYLGVFAALSWRFGSAAWRALAPSAVASLLTLAILGLLGEGLQLFHVLALLLVLGMGVDYGIFLLEHPSPGDGAPWLAVSLGAVSTLLAFGLLALSATPALHAFGLTLLCGIGLVWLMSPAFGYHRRPGESEERARDAAA